jgi:predicted dehydrogenase
MKRSSKIKVAVIGLGYWGPNLVRNFYKISQSRLMSVCDLKKERLNHIKSLYPDIHTTRAYTDILNNQDIDAVCVATPVSSHYSIAKKALENKKHVLVEKPLTDSSKKARKLIDIAKKNKVVLMVGHTFLYNEAVKKIKTILTNKELGNIYYISMERLNLGLFQKDINVVWDLAPHDISILKYITGEKPVAVSAIGKANVYKSVHDIAMINLKFKGGVTAHMRLSWTDPHKVRKTIIVGSKRMLVFDDIESIDKIKIYDKRVEIPSYYDTFKDFKFAYKDGKIKTPSIKNSEPLKLQCAHFIECIKRKQIPKSDGYNGLNVIKVIEAIQKSIKNDGYWEKIKW